MLQSRRGPKTAYYATLKKTKCHATIITRTRTVNPKTGEPTNTEMRWTGIVGFVQAKQAPQGNQVVVTDAWILTDQPLTDKSEVHAAGKAYTVLQLTQLDAYSIATLKAVTPATVYAETHDYLAQVVGLECQA